MQKNNIRSGLPQKINSNKKTCASHRALGAFLAARSAPHARWEAHVFCCFSFFAEVPYKMRFCCVYRLFSLHCCPVWNLSAFVWFCLIWLCMMMFGFNWCSRSIIKHCCPVWNLSASVWFCLLMCDYGLLNNFHCIVARSETGQQCNENC